MACVGRRLDDVLRCWCGTEDTFGADDADWAIYRKIVSPSLVCPYHVIQDPLMRFISFS